MSILDTLFGGLFGTEDQEQQKETVVERPCSNCPGYCSIAPDACSVCQPYKEQMIDAIYWVDHKEELLDRYEVTGAGGVQTGAVTCPHCGGHSENPYVCEYCGSRLQEGSGKIQVASAADIPNPVLEAQEIIFQRYEAVKGFAGADEAYGLTDALSGIETEGLLSSIFSALMGSGDSNDSRTIGNRMSESEIEQMAAFYGVSVGDYLEGLDNGKYLTLSNKQLAAKAEQQYQSTQSSSQSGGLSNLAGLAGMVGLGSMLFGGSSYNYSAARTPSWKRPTVVVQKPSQTHREDRKPTGPLVSQMPRPNTSARPVRPSSQQQKPPQTASNQARPKAPAKPASGGAASKPNGKTGSGPRPADKIGQKVQSQTPRKQAQPGKRPGGNGRPAI